MFDEVELAELMRKAAGSDPRLMADEDLLGKATSLVGLVAMAEAALMHTLGELEVRGVCDREFGLRTANWVATQTRCDRHGVGARVGLAGKLRSSFPAVDAALSDGAITIDHARAFGRIVNRRVTDQLAAEQDGWVAAAEDRPFRVWSHELKVRCELLDLEGPFDPNADLERNRLSLRPIGDGIALSGELHGEHAAAFKHHVEARAEQLWDEKHADHALDPDLPVPPFSTLMALALAELTGRGATDPPTGPAPPVEVSFVINTDDPDTATTPDGDIELPVERIAHLLCDAQLTLITTNLLGVILTMGRTRRLANRAQRRALAARDDGCTFPGCDVPAHRCDAHHVQHWQHDGTTDLPNLALLCRYHHAVTHRQGWTMTATNDQHFIWTTPSGRILHSQRHRGKPPPGT